MDDNYRTSSRIAEPVYFFGYYAFSAHRNIVFRAPFFESISIFAALLLNGRLSTTNNIL
jgi:hypothetical protein